MSGRLNPAVPPENKMGTKRIAPLLVGMALPMIASMLVQALYNIVDSYYIGKYSAEGLTALSLAFPVQNIQIGFSTGIAVGVNALLSKSLGAGDRERANRSAGTGIMLVFICVALFMAFGLFGARGFFAMQTSDAGVIAAGRDYVSVCCIFCIGLFTEILFERLLQASGRTVYTMITQGTGAILNILLDPVFIFGFGPVPALGTMGAAIATVTGQWVAALLAIVFNFRRNPDVKLAPRYLRLSREIVKPILIVGVPTAVMMAIGAVMNFSLNQILLGFRQGLVAASVFGVYYKLQSFFFMPVFGLNNATISIVAYNFGARKPERMKQAVRLGILIAVGIMSLGTLSFELLPEKLLSIFGQSEEFGNIGTVALRIIATHFPVAAVCIMMGGMFQALGTGIYSTITSLSRQLIVLLPAAWLLSLTGVLSNVWFAFPIAEVASLIVNVFFFVRIWRKKVKPLDAPAADGA